MDIKNVFEVNGKLDICYKGHIFKSDIQNIIGKYIFVSVPISEGRYIPFYKGDRIEILYYTKRDILKFTTNVLGGGDERVPVLVIEKPDKVIRVQRRNFVRIAHIMDLRYGILQDIKDNENYKNLQNKEVEFFECFSIDLSAGGIRIVTKEKLKIGDTLIVMLTLNEDTLPIHGKVVRIEEDENNRIICGVSFIDIDARTTEKIIMFVFKLMREQFKKASKGE